MKMIAPSTQAIVDVTDESIIEKFESRGFVRADAEKPAEQPAKKPATRKRTTKKVD